MSFQIGLPIPSEANDFHSPQVARLLSSYERCIGTPLVSPSATARDVWNAPAAIVSHVMLDDPIFWYGNRTALGLFEIGWDDFVRLPSRLSAEPSAQEDRNRLLAEVRAHGYSKSYRGVRIAKSGRRFWIEDAIVWNIWDERDNVIGQAATFDRWRFLD